jgi:osmotically-inducible protein OsmY
MTADSISAQRSRLGDDDLRRAVLNLLRSSGYDSLRGLRCEVKEAVVIVHGAVPSYFLKQMAQAIIQRLDGIRSVLNRVEVR